MPLAILEILHTISCLQNTLIVYKQTSALHIINPRVFFIYLFYKNI